jgi:hypothetical protein
MHRAACDFTLLKGTSQIDKDDPIEEGLYLRLIQELLSVCSNVEVIVLPQEWVDKWAKSDLVELQARPEEEEVPEYVPPKKKEGEVEEFEFELEPEDEMEEVEEDDDEKET